MVATQSHALRRVGSASSTALIAAEHNGTSRHRLIRNGGVAVAVCHVLVSVLDIVQQIKGISETANLGRAMPPRLLLAPEDHLVAGGQGDYLDPCQETGLVRLPTSRLVARRALVFGLEQQTTVVLGVPAGDHAASHGQRRPVSRRGHRPERQDLPPADW